MMRVTIRIGGTINLIMKCQKAKNRPSFTLISSSFRALGTSQPKKIAERAPPINSKLFAARWSNVSKMSLPPYDGMNSSGRTSFQTEKPRIEVMPRIQAVPITHNVPRVLGIQMFFYPVNATLSKTEAR